MKLSYRNPNDKTKVLGNDGYWIDHDDRYDLAFTGIYNEGEVIALVVGKEENSYGDYISDICDEIVGKVNAFDTLVQALVKAEEALRYSQANNRYYPEPVARHNEALSAVRDALKAVDLS
jgi:hypothetical protein